MKLAVLVSGSLGYDTLKKVDQNYNISCVFTDSKSEKIIKYCEKRILPFFTGNPRKGEGYSFIKRIYIDVLISVNYLFLIEDDIIGHPKKIAFNLHGSLLPKYRGRTPHVWAVINNEKKTGITAHKIDKGCDTGAIINQVEIPIDKEDTGADILEKYKDYYYPLVKKVWALAEKVNMEL
jgi:methionyl-tRNA formyltransferase